MKKICPNCKEEKELESDFYYVKTRNHYYPYCKKCKRKQEIERRKDYTEKHGLSRYSELRGKTLQGFLSAICSSLKSKAKRRGLACEIELKDLLTLHKKQKGKCALTGWEMTQVVGKGFVDKNISVDRIDSSKGYTLDNIQLVCRGANVFKGLLSQQDFLHLCKEVCKRNGYIVRKNNGN